MQDRREIRAADVGLLGKLIMAQAPQGQRGAQPRYINVYGVQ